MLSFLFIFAPTWMIFFYVKAIMGENRGSSAFES